MSLQKILLDIASETGIALANDNEKAYIIKMINDASRDLYEIQDIPGCLREQTFNIDESATTTSLVSLPYYVDQIRGIRYSQILGGKIPQNDMRPRYHGGRGWGANSFSMPFRVVREHYPLKRDISNASVLTFTLPQVESVDIIIHITGETTNSQRTSEEVTIVADSLTVDTLGNFIEIQQIEKEQPSNYDIKVTDVESNELAVIHNAELSPLYKIIELQDNNAGLGQVQINRQLSAIDLLYKVRFTPFVNLFDEFPCPRCDRIIFYKFCEYYAGQQPGNETSVAMAIQKAQSLLDNLCVDTEKGKVLEIEWGRNGFNDAQNPYSWYKHYGRERVI